MPTAEVIRVNLISLTVCCLMCCRSVPRPTRQSARTPTRQSTRLPALPSTRRYSSVGTDPYHTDINKMSWARDSTAATKIPRFQTTKLLFIQLCLYSCCFSPFRHRHLNFFLFFLSLKVYYVVALSLSRTKKCRVPSSVIKALFYTTIRRALMLV